MEAADLLKELLGIPSPSGRENEIGEFLAKRLEKKFDVKKQRVGDRFNVLATKGTPRLLFTTHMDTVPKHLEIKEDADFIYGRGACDAKGPLACMVCACETAADKGLRDFGMLFDVGEEDDFCGIIEAIKTVEPEQVIVGEPTGFKVAYGQKGLLLLKVRCAGKSAPGATPERGISAIQSLIGILGKLAEIELPKDKLLGVTTMNIGEIRGGTAPNIVPDYAEALIDVRTATPNDNVLRALGAVIPGDCLEVVYQYDAVVNDDAGFAERFGLEKTTVPYFTEMYFWTRAKNARAVGPGDYAYAHSGEERIRKDDLARGAELYLKIIGEYCAHSSREDKKRRAAGNDAR